MKLPIISNVPVLFDKGTRWLEEFKNAVTDSFKMVHDYDVLYVEPDKLKLAWFVILVLLQQTAIASEGLWVYQSTGWVKAT